MSGLPWLPLHAAEYLTDAKIGALTWTQQAVAVRLWCVSWVSGPLPNDLAAIRRVGWLVDVDPADVQIVLAALWTATDDGRQLFSSRLEDERTRRRPRSRRRRNGRGGRLSPNEGEGGLA